MPAGAFWNNMLLDNVFRGDLSPASPYLATTVTATVGPYLCLLYATPSANVALSGTAAQTATFPAGLECSDANYARLPCPGGKANWYPTQGAYGGSAQSSGSASPQTFANAKGFVTAAFATAQTIAAWAIVMQVATQTYGGATAGTAMVCFFGSFNGVSQTNAGLPFIIGPGGIAMQWS